MENAQKAIMVGVGLFITIIIISAVMLISSAGQDLIDSSMEELNNLSDSFSRQLYADFANGTFSGSEVIAAVKKYAGSEVKVYVARNDGDVTYNSTSNTWSLKNSPTEYTATNVGSVTTKVISTGKYLSKVFLDVDSKVVKGIAFIRK